jgi:hypothetical protein
LQAAARGGVGGRREGSAGVASSGRWRRSSAAAQRAPSRPRAQRAAALRRRRLRPRRSRPQRRSRAEASRHLRRKSSAAHGAQPAAPRGADTQRERPRE